MYVQLPYFISIECQDLTALCISYGAWLSLMPFLYALCDMLAGHI